ncbi:hypothetical protein, partial [Streptomyces roseoviridis]
PGAPVKGRCGRGRPQVFTPDVREKYLAAVAGGAYLGAAAALAGVGPDQARRHAAKDSAFADALEKAKAAGRQARQADAPHDESRYNNLGCRCPTCRKAASTARMARDARAKQKDRDDQPAPPSGEPEVPYFVFAA